jgi:ubiquinone/menaquinone biosynthesis C-methylase UbiE
MNTIWSAYIQGTQTLYRSRKLRFDDGFAAQYLPHLDIPRDRRIRILEIGCGPGALAAALQRWYPNADITAVDRDSTFIRFAKEHHPNIEFIEGDATALPFADGSFDVTISNTVSEHIEPTAFYGEQHRVLRPGGICLVLSARKGYHHTAPCLAENEMERAFWEAVAQQDDSMKKYAVCAYPMSEAELPRAMQQHGFCSVSTGYAAIDLTPDNPKYSAPLALDMIEAAHLCEVEFVESAAYSLPDCVTQEKKQQMLQRIEQKYAERRRLYEQGEAQWDTTVSITMIVRGIKKERDNTQ